MALEILYTPQFTDHLEAILSYFDVRNGSDKYSQNLFQMVYGQIPLLATMPEIGRLIDFPGVRILFVEN
jgi:hypothetical protein